MYIKKDVVLLIAIVSFFSCMARADQVQLPIGNFALPPSQWPGLLFGFGQSIIDANDVVFFDNLTIHHFKKGHILFNEIALLYAPTDYFAILPSIYAPVDHKTDSCHKSTGVGDITVQGEYALIKKESFDYYASATVVADMTFPTGSAKINRPPTGLGSVSFFLGGTLYYVDFDWYMFTSIGNQFMTKHHGNKFGDILYYQAGIGYNLKHMKDKILVLLLEFDGYLLKHDILCNRVEPNTGSNTIFLGPTLFFSTPKWSMGIGMQAVAYQKLNGNQPKNNWFFGFRFNWLLHHDPQ